MPLTIHILLGGFYLFLFAAVIKRFNKNKPTGLSDRWLFVFFGAKMLAGCCYGYLYAHYFPSSDSWFFFNESLKEYDHLLHHPGLFFTTDMEFHSLTDVFSNADNATWRNFDDNLFIKLLGLLNLLSFGNYYVNVILLNCCIFWGLFRLNQVVFRHFPVHPLWIAGFLFLLPSTLFWNSGLHKDGLIVFFICLIIAGAERLFRREKLVGSWLLLLGSLFIVFLLRNISALLLVPPLVAWWLCGVRTEKPVFIFFTVHLLFAVLFFATTLAPSSYNLPLLLAEKQQQFLTLEGNSRLATPHLDGSLMSYLKNLPIAVDHGFLRPHPAEAGHPLYLAAFLELVLVIAIACFTVYRLLRQHFSVPGPLIWVLLFSSFTAILIIGYTVPFTGAIVRYRAFYLSLICIAFIGWGHSNKQAPQISSKSS